MPTQTLYLAGLAKQYKLAFTLPAPKEWADSALTYVLYAATEIAPLYTSFLHNTDRFDNLQHIMLYSYVTETLLNKKVLLTQEYLDGTDAFATIIDADSKEDLGHSIVSSGFLFAAKRREPFFKNVVTTYEIAQQKARTSRVGMWVYGDVSSDDAKVSGFSIDIARSHILPQEFGFTGRK